MRIRAEAAPLPPPIVTSRKLSSQQRREERKKILSLVSPPPLDMGEVPEIHLPIRVQGAQGLPNDATSVSHPPRSSFLKQWRWWLMVAVNILFLLAGQTAAILLGRFYYDQGGNSTWTATLVQTAGFPLLFLPLILFPSPPATSPSTPRPPVAKMALIYIALGLIIAGDNLMYSYGLLYLPASTYSLICASQLAFNAVFAYFLNSQKFTLAILNSVVCLTFSAALLGVDSDSDGSSTDIPKDKYPLGFVLTLGASAVYSLTLSLMQRTFEKVLKRETFSVVLEMQICTSIVSTCAAVVGLFASGEWRGLRGEYEGYEKGRVSYVMTLVWTAVSWQVASVGVVGLIFVVSSLFSNVISTLALPVVPIFAVIFFGDKMDAVKGMSLAIALWGFLSYIYQQYEDDSKAKKAVSDLKDLKDDSMH